MKNSSLTFRHIFLFSEISWKWQQRKIFQRSNSQAQGQLERCYGRQEMLNFVNKFVETESRCRSGNWLKREEKCEIKVPDTKLKQAESLHGAQEGPRNRRHGKRQRHTDTRRTGRKKSPEPCPTPWSNMTTRPGLTVSKWQVYSLRQLNQTGPRREEARHSGAQGWGTRMKIKDYKEEKKKNENKGLTRFRRSKQWDLLLPPL